MLVVDLGPQLKRINRTVLDCRGQVRRLRLLHPKVGRMADADKAVSNEILLEWLRLLYAVRVEIERYESRLSDRDCASYLLVHERLEHCMEFAAVHLRVPGGSSGDD